jgi:putative oxidoreductase
VFNSPQWLRDSLLVLARVVVGGVFAAHGYQKLFVKGPDSVAAGFEKLGIPAPTLSAWFASLVEFFGGIAFALGVLAPLVGVLLTLVMAGALLWAHGSQGFFLPTGSEYVVVLAAVSLGLGFGTAHLSVTDLFRSTTVGRRRAKV